METEAKPKKKTDRRVIRTKRMLLAAFFDLLAEKSYSEITVGDITERADIGRATFYLYYKSKDEMLFENTSQVMREVESVLNTLLTSPAPFATEIFAHAKDNQGTYNLLVKSQAGPVLEKRFHGMLLNVMREYLDQKFVGRPTIIAKDVIAEYMVGATINTLRWWLENDMPHEAEYMGDTLRLLHENNIFTATRPSMAPRVTVRPKWKHEIEEEQNREADAPAGIGILPKQRYIWKHEMDDAE